MKHGRCIQILKLARSPKAPRHDGIETTERSYAKWGGERRDCGDSLLAATWKYCSKTVFDGVTRKSSKQEEPQTRNEARREHQKRGNPTYIKAGQTEHVSSARDGNKEGSVRNPSTRFVALNSTRSSSARSLCPLPGAASSPRGNRLRNSSGPIGVPRSPSGRLSTRRGDEFRASLR